MKNNSNTKSLQYLLQDNMENKNIYKYIELLNGDRLLAEINLKESVDGFLKIVNPLKMIVIEDEETINYNFTPWVPFSNDKVYPLSQRSITTIATLNEETVELYTKAVKRIIDKNMDELIQEDEQQLINQIGYLN